MNLKKFLGNGQVKNGMWLYVLQLFNTVIPLITLPYITRILGATEYGKFSIAFNLIAYFQVVVEYGFGMSGARTASLAKNTQDLYKPFTSIMISRGILCSLCLLLMGIYSLLYVDSNAGIGCLLYLFLIPLGTILDQTWIFQGLQKMKYITITSVAARLISLLCVFIFVNDSTDLLIYCICYSSTTLLMGIIGTAIVVKNFKIKFIKVNFKDIIDEFKSGWYVFTTAFSSKILSAFGITVMGVMLSPHDVGLYSAIQKIPSIMLLAFSPIGQVLYPMSSKWMNASYKEGKKRIKKYEMIVVGTLSIISFVVALSSKLLIRILFGIEYVDKYYIVYPLLVWLVLSIANNFKGVQTLLGGGFDKEYSRCFQISVICTIVFNLVLIKYNGLEGAAVAPMLSEAVLFLLLTIVGKKIDIKINNEARL